MDVIIIEDEKPASRRLQRQLSSLGIQTKGILHSVSEAVEWLLNNKHPDLIFLDIQLSDGLSFEIFEEVQVNSSIIFTTAYDEYALKAFKFNSIDYLLKPIDPDELEQAINKYKKNTQNDTLDLNTIKNIFGNTQPKYKTRFTVKIGQHIRIIQTQEIIAFYSENKTTYILTKENRNYIIDKSLEDLEPLLNPQIFFKINRKMIVNIHFIEDIIVYSNSRLKLKIPYFTNFEIIVSREKVKNFKNWLGNE